MQYHAFKKNYLRCICWCSGATSYVAYEVVIISWQRCFMNLFIFHCLNKIFVFRKNRSSAGRGELLLSTHVLNFGYWMHPKKCLRHNKVLRYLTLFIKDAKMIIPGKRSWTYTAFTFSRTWNTSTLEFLG